MRSRLCHNCIAAGELLYRTASIRAVRVMHFDPWVAGSPLQGIEVGAAEVLRKNCVFIAAIITYKYKYMRRKWPWAPKPA